MFPEFDEVRNIGCEKLLRIIESENLEDCEIEEIILNISDIPDSELAMKVTKYLVFFQGENITDGLSGWLMTTSHENVNVWVENLLLIHFDISVDVCKSESSTEDVAKRAEDKKTKELLNLIEREDLNWSEIADIITLEIDDIEDCEMALKIAQKLFLYHGEKFDESLILLLSDTKHEKVNAWMGNLINY